MTRDPLLTPHPSPGFFITGTDTGVGKTLVATGLLTALAGRGRKAVGMKPVASGCRATPAGLRNGDAELLLRCGSIRADYGDVNPYAFAPAVAPHLAAQAAGREIGIATICRHFKRLRARAEVVVVEGVGGWFVPLNREHLVADLARALDLPVLVVVGIRLGCLNHALLTAQAIHRSGLPMAGWVANQIDPGSAMFEENLAALGERIPAPLIGIIPRLDPVLPEKVGRHLELGQLGLD